MTKCGLVLFWILLFPCRILQAQSAPASPPDSIPDSSPVEEILEQAAVRDDSPFPDFSPFDPNPGRTDFLVKIRSRINLELEQSRGYREGVYLGSPVKSYDRVELGNRGKIGLGALVEKDAGEPRLADFASGYAMLSDAGPLGVLLLGDYVVESGQGIALWRGTDYVKGPDVVRGVRRSGRGIVPYRSSDETAYLRGIAAEVHSTRISTSIFYSHRLLGASLDSSGGVIALYTSGDFRTAPEESKRNALGEDLLGFRGTLHFGEGKGCGITYYRTHFSRRVNLAGGSGYSGDRYELAALDYTFEIPRAVLFGEWAASGGTPGGMSGVLLTPSTAVDLLGAIRHYPAHFASLHGLGFGEHTSTSDENGLYLGIRLKVARKITLSSYYDEFSFPEGSAGNPFASSGHEWLVQLGLFPGPQVKALIQYMRKGTEIRKHSSSENLPATITADRTIQRFRVHLDCRFSDALRIRGRMESLFLDQEIGSYREVGNLLYEDVAFSPNRVLSLSLRVVLFRTGSYETRIYENEDDLNGAMSVPALFGQGERWYILGRFRSGIGLDLSAKYSRLGRDDVRHLGTGLDELPGNEDDRIGVQLDFLL